MSDKLLQVRAHAALRMRPNYAALYATPRSG